MIAKSLVPLVLLTAALAACSPSGGSATPGADARLEDGILLARTDATVLVDGEPATVRDVRFQAVVAERDGTVEGTGTARLGDDALGFALTGTSANGRYVLEIETEACGSDLVLEIEGSADAGDAAIVTQPTDVTFACGGQRVEATLPALELHLAELR